VATFDGILKSGGFPGAYIFHITGMPWAATNSPELKAYLDADSAPAVGLKRKLFGIVNTTPDPAAVQILNILDDDVGSQTIRYGEDLGINVGPWRVKLKADNPSGFDWDGGGAFTPSGILGLTWQPNEYESGAYWGVLQKDLEPATTGTPPVVTLKWAADGRDFGLKTWLTNNWGGAAYTTPSDLWVGSTCVRPYTAVTTTTGEAENFHYVDCYTSIWNTPNEAIPAFKDDQNIIVSNYPQGIAGMHAYLYGVEMAPDGTVNSGTQPFTLAQGRVKPGTKDNGAGTWTLSMSGLTDQLKLKATGRRFSASLAKYQFNINNNSGYLDSGSGVGRDHAVHLYVIESDASTVGYTAKEIDISASTYQNYDTLDEVGDAIVARMNADATLGGVYRWQNGDIVLESGATFVAVAGVIPWILGCGYVHWQDLERYCDNAFNTQGNPDFKPPLQDSTAPLTFRPFVNNSAGTNIFRPAVGPMMPFYIRDLDDGGSNTWDAGTEKLVRNACWSPYFIQFDLRDVADGETPSQFPLNASLPGGTRTVTMSADPDEGVLEAGKRVAFGPPFNDTQQRWGLVDAYTAGNTTFTLDTVNSIDGYVKYMPWGMSWSQGLAYALTEDAAYQDAFNDVANAAGVPVLVGGNGRRGTGETVIDDSNVFGTAQGVASQYNLDDPYAITDVTTVRSSTPVRLIRDLLGASGITGTGLSTAIKQTDTADLVDRGQYNHLERIDWTALQTIVDESGLSDCDYTIKVREDNSISDKLDFDVMSLLNQVALTHGGRMVWEWNETERCHRIGFKKLQPDTLAQARLSGREILSGEVLAMAPSTGTDGEQWIYSTIKAEYQRQDGGTQTFNTKNRNGRARHIAKDRTLSFSDNMTLLPTDNQSTTDELTRRFAGYQQLYSVPKYTHNLPTTLSALRRVEVGKSCLFTSEAALDRGAGKRNNGTMLGEVRALTINLGGSPSLMVELTTDPIQRTGIAPSVYVTTYTATGTTVEVTGLATDPANNDFGDPGDAVLTDIAYFGCFDNIDGTLTARDCSCTDYAVTIFERNTSALYFDPAYLYASQNVWRGTVNVTAADIAAGTCTITLEDANQFPASGTDMVMIFSDRADANTQTCQTDLYGYLGQVANGARCTDSAAATHPAITVGL
jgi:hypothetical protein